MDTITDKLANFLPLNTDQLHKLYITIAIILILRIISLVTSKTAAKRITDIHRLYNWRKAITIIAHVFGILIIGRIWIEEFRHLLTILGIISVGIAIAYKEIFMNITGGLFILWRGLFREGDRIQIGEHHGDVIGFGLFYFTLMEIGGGVTSEQSSGRIIKVPNGMIINNPIINYNRCFPYIWNEIPVRLTPESNRKEAEQLLLNIAQKVNLPSADDARKCFRRKSDEIIIYRHLDPAVYLSVRTERPAGIILTLRYLCDPRQRRNTEKVIWDEILDVFDKNTAIHLAFEK